MKKLYSCLVWFSLFLPLVIHAQKMPKHSITIDGSVTEFSEFTVATSKPGAGKVPITREILKQGFRLSVTSGTKTLKVRVKVADEPKTDKDPSQPDPSTFATRDTVAAWATPGIDSYFIEDPHIENDAVLIMTIHNAEESDFKIYKLNVKKEQGGGVGGGAGGAGAGGAGGGGDGGSNPCVCEKIELASDAGCVVTALTPGNDFGETVEYYDHDKVVYVYDFNNDINKRALFKVVKKKGKNGNADEMVTTIANPNRERLKPNSHVEVKIVNVNKFLYDVDVSGTDVDFGSEPSVLFRELFVGDSAGLLGNLLGLFKSGVGDETSLQKNKQSEPTFCKIECVLKGINVLHAEALKAYSPCDDFPCCQSKRLGEIYIKIADLMMEAKVEMSTIQNTVASKKKQLNKLKADLKACEDITAEIAVLAADESKLTDEQKKKLAALRAKKCTDDQVKKFKDDIAPLQEQVDSYSVITEINAKLPSELELRKLIVFIEHIIKMNQTHVAGPFFPDGNQFDLEIQLQTKDSLPSYFGFPPFSNTIGAKIPVLYKGFVSFSSGSFVSLQNNLVNKTYTWQQVPISGQMITDTTSHQLVESGYTRRPLGFAALGNVEWKLWRSFGIGASVGVGLTIEREPRPAYLGGASLFFGNLRQFALTFGVIGMEVNTLSNNYKSMADAQIRVKTKPTTPIEEYKGFRIGTFFSVTYTPFRSDSRRSKSNSSTKRSNPPAASNTTNSSTNPKK